MRDLFHSRTLTAAAGHHLQWGALSPCQILALSAWKSPVSHVCLRVGVAKGPCCSPVLDSFLSSPHSLRKCWCSCCPHNKVPLVCLGSRSPRCSIFWAHPRDHWGLEGCVSDSQKRPPVHLIDALVCVWWWWWRYFLHCYHGGEPRFQGIMTAGREHVWAAESLGDQSSVSGSNNKVSPNAKT